MSEYCACACGDAVSVGSAITMQPVRAKYRQEFSGGKHHTSQWTRLHQGLELQALAFSPLSSSSTIEECKCEEAILRSGIDRAVQFFHRSDDRGNRIPLTNHYPLTFSHLPHGLSNRRSIRPMKPKQQKWD